MPERSTLLLLTNRYPYGTGEEYLEQEIAYLAAEFEKIIIAPCMAATLEVRRRTPSNVEVLCPPTFDHHRSLPGLFASGARTKPLDTVNPIKFAYDSYFLGRSRAIASDLQDRLHPVLDGGAPDVIYSYWFYVTAMVGGLLRERNGWNSPLISRAHGYDINVDASPVKYLPSRELLLQKCDSVHPVSELATRYLKERYPSYAHKVSTRRLGTPAAPASSMGSLEVPTVVSCSMIRPLKRLHLIGEAVEYLRADGLPVKWVHLGDGKGRYADGLKKRFAASPLTFFPGYIQNQDIYATYQQLQPSVLVNASSTEGVPVSVMEALSCGIPVLATRAGGTQELLDKVGSQQLLPLDLTAKELANSLKETIFCLSNADYATLKAAHRQAWEATSDAAKIFTAFAKELQTKCIP